MYMYHLKEWSIDHHFRWKKYNKGMNRPKELLLLSSFVYVFSMSRNNLIKALCTFKEIPVKGKLYSTMFNQSFSADGAVCSLKEDREGLFDLRIDGVSHHS